MEKITAYRVSGEIRIQESEIRNQYASGRTSSSLTSPTQM
jgi:hypothetical protein